MTEGCERLERLLDNFVNVMFGKWEYPLWEPISGVGKITKYNLWYLLLMSGEVVVDENLITFKTKNSDIGFETQNQVYKVPDDVSKEAAFRVFLDKDIIDATLK